MQPTLEQQEVLQRIAAQRERLRLRREARARDGTADDARIDPEDPLPARLLAFARLHPLATAAALGVVSLAGPGRLIRWAGVVLPIVLRLRR